MNQASDIHEGGCLCGAVRYRVHGRPRYLAACHCRFCQRVTGSAFLAEVVFPAERVQFLGLVPRTYSYRSPDHGRVLRPQFCAACGTTIGLTFERFPNVQAIAGGTFDDPQWFSVDKHIFTRTAMPWVCFGEQFAIYEDHSIRLDGSSEIPLRPANPKGGNAL